MRAVVLLFSLALALPLSACGPTQVQAACSPSNCATCCDGTGTCVASVSVFACGNNGGACSACGPGNACTWGTCVPQGEVDAGVEVDAGQDAGASFDASVDAGTSFDASVDAGTSVDAGMDAGQPVDSGVVVDAGTCTAGNQSCNGACISTCAVCPASPRAACVGGFDHYRLDSEVVTTASRAVNFSGLKVRFDPGGATHLSWTDTLDGGITQYATNRAGAWQVETVAAPNARPSASVRASRFALASCGTPAVAYLRQHVPAGTNTGVTQAFLSLRTTAGWTEELIPVPTSDTDASPATDVTSIDLASDDAGTLYFGAKRASWGAPVVLTRSAAGVWTSEVVPFGAGGLSVPVLSWHASVGLMVAYGNTPTVALKQAGSWAQFPVPGARSLTSTTFGYQPRIAVGANAAGRVSLAWESSVPNSRKALFIAHLVGGTWTAPQELLNASGWAGDALNLWHSRQGEARVSYEAYGTGGSVTPSWGREEDGDFTLRSVASSASGAGGEDDTGRAVFAIATNAGLRVMVQACATCLGGVCPQTVASAGSQGGSNAIAVTAQGAPTLAYTDTTRGSLKVARHDGARWVRETVEAGGQVGGYASLKLDAQGRAHIAYHASTARELHYARWDGAVWLVEVVDTAGDVGAFSSLALDATGAPHIAYFDSTNTALKYARWTGTAWAVETVDDTGDRGRYASLAVDAQGRAHIAYADYDAFDLKYATWTGTAWAVTTVDSAGDVGRSAALALDAQGQPHIAYLDATQMDLKHAFASGGQWTLEVADSAGDVGMGNAIAIDPAGVVHVTTSDSTRRQLRYARKTAAGWTAQGIDTFSNVCLSSGVAVDAQGAAHLSFCDPNNSDVKYAKVP